MEPLPRGEIMRAPGPPSAQRGPGAGLGWEKEGRKRMLCPRADLEPATIHGHPGRRLLGARPVLGSDTGTRVSDFLPSKDASSSTHSCSVSGIGRHS